MKNITQEFLDKLELESFGLHEDEVVKLDEAKVILQDFEVALLNEIKDKVI